MVRAALAQGWFAEPAPQLAFRNSAAAQRLYLRRPVGAVDYARRWEAGDLQLVGAYEQTAITQDLWPWLKQRGYASDADDGTFERFLEEQLGRRPAFLRPGLNLHGFWSSAAIESAGGQEGVAELIRADVDSILAAAREPALPGGGADR